MTDAETLREQAPFAARWLTCPECGRGLIYHIDRNMTRCYVCNIECRRVGPWHEFDVKPEIVQITPDDLVAAMLSEIAHKVLTWCVGEDYVVNPLLLKDIKEQVAVRLYRPVFGLSAQPKQKEKTDAEREKALKELHYFLGMSPELFMEVHGI